MRPSAPSARHDTARHAGSFQILAYTSTAAPIPSEWAVSAPQLIDESKAEQVRLRSFSTAVHRVEAMVAYRRDEQ